MDMNVLLTTIEKMGVLMALGLIVAKFFPITPEIRKFMIFIIVNFAMPGIILNGVLQLKFDSELIGQVALALLLSFFLHLLGLLVGWLAAKSARFESYKAKEASYLSAMGNSGIIGIPLCATVFGPKGALFASMFDTGMAIMAWSIGIMLLNKNNSISFKSLKNVINLPIISIVVALSLAFMQVQPPELFKQITFSLAQMATPFAMMYIGMLLYSNIKNLKNINPSQLVLPITVKLLIFPVLVMVLLISFSIHRETSHVFFMEAMMPTLTAASIIFARCEANEQLALMTTLISTVLALITIPLLFTTGQYLFPEYFL